MFWKHLFSPSLSLSFLSQESSQESKWQNDLQKQNEIFDFFSLCILLKTGVTGRSSFFFFFLSPRGVSLSDIYMYMSVCMYRYVCMYVCMYTHVWPDLYIHTDMRCQSFGNICICLYVCIDMYVCMYVYICIYIYHMLAGWTRREKKKGTCSGATLCTRVGVVLVVVFR